MEEAEECDLESGEGWVGEQGDGVDEGGCAGEENEEAWAERPLKAGRWRVG